MREQEKRALRRRAAKVSQLSLLRRKRSHKSSSKYVRPDSAVAWAETCIVRLRCPHLILEGKVPAETSAHGYTDNSHGNDRQDDRLDTREAQERTQGLLFVVENIRMFKYL